MLSSIFVCAVLVLAPPTTLAQNTETAGLEVPEQPLAPETVKRPAPATPLPEAAKPVVAAANSATPTTANDVVAAMLWTDNAIRAKYGKPARQSSPELNYAAQNYAEYLSRTNGMGHYADGKSPGERIAATGFKSQTWAENMAAGQTSVHSAFTAWVNSSGHLSNILGNTTQAGYGHAGAYWVAAYATPAGQQQAQAEVRAETQTQTTYYQNCDSGGCYTYRRGLFGRRR